jgi:hypothetical protein
MRRFVRDHSLSIVALGAFLVIWLGGQAWSGHRAFNDEQRAHGEPTVGFGEYLTRADFGEATFENWESEFLQMGVYVLLTAWLVQKGSAETVHAYRLTFTDPSGLSAMLRVRGLAFVDHVPFQIRDPSPTRGRLVEVSGTEDWLLPG